MKDYSQEDLTSSQDFKLDGPVKWCAGCGAHAVLSAVRKALPETRIKKENVVFVSGIGCSSRFPLRLAWGSAILALC